MIARGRVRSANKKGGFENVRALKEAENIRPQRPSITAPGAFSGRKEKMDTSPSQDDHVCANDEHVCDQDKPPTANDAQDKPQRARFKGTKIEVETVVDDDDEDGTTDTGASSAPKLYPSNRDGIHRHAEGGKFAEIDVRGASSPFLTNMGSRHEP